MTKQWSHIVEALEPRIRELTQMLEQGPRIKPALIRNRQGAWQITLKSSFDDPELFQVTDFPVFDSRVEWLTEESENWDCWRSSYDTWVFSSKDEAEKFITFYLLKWASE